MIKSNKSRTYLLPLIAPIIGIEEKFYDLIENTFMFDSNNEYKDCFFIVQNFSFKNPEFTAYEHRITNNDLFVKAIDIKDKVIYIYKFPKEYTHEYYEFMESRYSTFLEDAKKQILKFWTIIKGKQISGASFILKIKQILYKDKKLREEIEKNLGVKIADEAELGNHVDLNMETINLEKY
jgi:hypothetical protein